jgi:hypothetical protein
MQSYNNLRNILIVLFSLALSSCGKNFLNIIDKDQGLNKASTSGNNGISTFDPIDSTPWITQLGAHFTGTDVLTTGEDYCYSVAVDNTGNVYCAGSTTKNLDASEGGVTHGERGNHDAFVMKLSPQGEVLWITQLGSQFTGPDISFYTNSDTECNDIEVDDEGNVFCAGMTYGNIDASEGGVTHASGGANDAFVMKLDTEGNIVWVTQLGQHFTGINLDKTKNDSCNGISLDDDGNIYCAGWTLGNLDSGAGNSNAGAEDAFVMKLNSDGVVQWVTQLGGQFTGLAIDTSQADFLFSISVDTSGNIYCAGHTRGNLDASEGGSAHGNGGSADAFILKLNSTGDVQWVTQLGSHFSGADIDTTAFEVFSSVVVDSFGNIYGAGYTGGMLDASEGGVTHLNGGGNDAFVAKLSSSGDIQWVTQLGSHFSNADIDVSFNDSLDGIDVDSEGNVYAAGYTVGDLDNSPGSSNSGSADAFVIKLDSSGIVQWESQLGTSLVGNDILTSSFDRCRDIKVDHSGNIYCAGYTNGNLEASENPGEHSNGGLGDVFVLKLGPNGELP